MLTRLDCKQSPFKGQDVFERQSQVGIDGFGILLLIIFLLCELTILAKLGMELYLIFTLFRLQILYSLCDFGKCLSRIVKKLLPMLVETLLLYGGLNHMIFLFLLLLLLIFLFYFSAGIEHFKLQINRTSCAQVHELPQSHCGDNREGALFL